MNSKELKHIFNSFAGIRVLVIGDVMIDSYYWGNVNRISPEAPVPVVTVDKKEIRLGGAGNVALNLMAMGAHPMICGVIGDDDNGNRLSALMKQYNLSSQCIVKAKERPTTTKTRIISHNHHLVRIDEETDTDVTANQTDRLLNLIRKYITAAKPKVILFEDYDKGVITKKLITEVLKISQKTSIPVVVDPKKRNFSNYTGVKLFKPNLKELQEGTQKDIAPFDIRQIEKVADELRIKQKIDILLVTLSEHGVYVSSEKEKKRILAHVRNIADVSGAGDTLISVAALCCAIGLSPGIIAFLSNLAGGQVCEKTGVVPVDKNQLLKEAIQYTV